MLTLNQMISKTRKKYLNISVDWKTIKDAYDEIDFDETIADSFIIILRNVESKQEIEDDSVEQYECWNLAVDLVILKILQDKHELYEPQ